MKIFLNIIALFSVMTLTAQKPVFTIETETAPCGGMGKMIFTGLSPSINYKISMNNGVSFTIGKPDAEGKITKTGLAGEYDIIMQNDFGRITGKHRIPSEGIAPTFTLSQEPSVCGEVGNITVEGLTAGEIYRVSTTNGESYKHLTASSEGTIQLPVHGGRYDILVANDCGFTKGEITVGREGDKPDFTVETEPSQCDKIGTIILNGLEPAAKYHLSIDGGENFEFINADESGAIKKGAKPAHYELIVKTSCGTARQTADITSEGSAPNFTTAIEMENELSKNGTIVFSGLEPVNLYQISFNGGENYSFITADSNGEIRKEMEKGLYNVIIKNKCGSSTEKITVGNN